MTMRVKGELQAWFARVVRAVQRSGCDAQVSLLRRDEAVLWCWRGICKQYAFDMRVWWPWSWPRGVRIPSPFIVDDMSLLLEMMERAWVDAHELESCWRSPKWKGWPYNGLWRAAYRVVSLHRLGNVLEQETAPKVDVLFRGGDLDIVGEKEWHLPARVSDRRRRNTKISVAWESLAEALGMIRSIWLTTITEFVNVSKLVDDDAPSLLGLKVESEDVSVRFFIPRYLEVAK